jgi:hypothetical protein
LKENPPINVILKGHGLQPCKLLVMQNAFQRKFRETNPTIILSHLTTEESLSTVDVPGNAVAKPPQNIFKCSNLSRT